jgi:hypothetical protein
MDNRNEILFAIREARRNMGQAADFRIADALTILEGIAPFLNKENIIAMKCKNCDNYAAATFPLNRDFWAVDENEYCHAKDASLKNLTATKLAGCPQYSSQASHDLIALGTAIMEEDLRPAFQERKLYDRSKFASYTVAFRLQSSPGNVCIELGHRTDDGFACSDIKLYILRRLDPGFGAVASQKIAGVMKSSPIIVVQSSQHTRRQLDIDYVLEWIAEKRKMDLVYL